MLKTMISACRHPIPQNDAASQRILLLPTHTSGITLYRINYVIFHSLHKQYDVTYKYKRDNVTVDTMDEVIVGPAKATYNEDYSFSIRPRDDTSYSVRAIWGMSTDTQTTLRGTANPDGTITYTLDKYYVKKDFRICIDATSGNGAIRPCSGGCAACPRGAAVGAAF